MTNDKDKATELVESVFGKPGTSPIYQTAGRLIAGLVDHITAALTTVRKEARQAAWTQVLNMARVTATSTGMPEIWALYEALKRESEKG